MNPFFDFFDWRYLMNDWNGNGKYDTQDSWMDYKMSNSYSSSGVSSDW